MTPGTIQSQVVEGKDRLGEGEPRKKEKKVEIEFVPFLTIIFRAPGCAVNVNVIRIQAEGTCFHLIRHGAIQHTDTTDAGIVRDPHAAEFIKCLRSNFSRTAGTVPVNQERVGCDAFP